MGFMSLRKADACTEANQFPPVEVLAAMGDYHDAMVKAGVMLGGDALLGSSAGARLRWSGGKMSVTDGPFRQARELIAG